MWHGWHFVRGVWQRVCQAPTVGECSRLLSRLVPGERNNLAFGLTKGGVPDWHPAHCQGDWPRWK